MIFGIDFGTTHTVVSWFSNNEYKFLDWGNNDSLSSDSKTYLKKTELRGMDNIKRKMTEDSSSIYSNESEIFKVAKDFFELIHIQINKNEDLKNSQPIKDCVLTVPARFDDLARNAIKSAAIAGGFNVLRIIAEPVAAAISQVKNKKNGLYLVYDLGGGTFDVTLLKLVGDVYQILSIEGLKDFGGIDIDKIISEHQGISLEEARILKEQGAFEDNLYKMIEKELLKTYEISFSLLKDKGFDIKDLNAVILVGGSSRLAMIRKHFQDFGCVVEQKDPDFAVALGAAMHAKSLLDDDHLLVDIVPFNLGIENLEGEIEVIIPKNSPIPCAKSEFFMPSNNGKVLINILQGNFIKASECVSLGRFNIANHEKIEVVFLLDCDGILSLKVADEVFMVSLKKEYFNKDLDDILQEINGMENLNPDQKKLVVYIKQAVNMELSQVARQWINKMLLENFPELIRNKQE